MNIHQFEYVLAVVDSNNFEEAAEKCHISQSNLSTMIGRLEDEIGIRIFNRKTKPVSITKEGKVIIEKLRVITNEIAQFKQSVQELKGEMVGELSIGIIPTVAPYILPLFLNAFSKSFPKLKIILREIPTEQIVLSLKKRDLDIGILALPVYDNELIEDELYVEPFLVYDCRSNSKGGSVAIEDIDFSKLWLLQKGHCLRTQVHQICEQLNKIEKRPFNFEFESGSMDSLLRFTRSNNGITILPYLASMTMDKDQKKQIHEFVEPIPSRSIGLLTHKHFVKKELAKSLKNILLKEVKLKIPNSANHSIIDPV